VAEDAALSRRKRGFDSPWSYQLSHSSTLFDRVHILGCPGSGKTTLGHQIGERLGLPVIDLDDVYHGPRWQPPDPEVFRARMKEIAAQPRFVLSGNYSSAWDVRLTPGDLLIMIDVPRLEAVRRIIWRSFKIRFGGRIDLLPKACCAGPDHEPLRDYPAFIKFTWDCAGRRQPRVDRLRSLGINEMIYLSGASQIGDFTAHLQNHGHQALRDRLGPLPSFN
jgi:Shikimate kinase